MWAFWALFVWRDCDGSAVGHLGTCRDGHDAPDDADAGLDPWLDRTLALSMCEDHYNIQQHESQLGNT